MPRVAVDGICGARQQQRPGSRTRSMHTFGMVFTATFFPVTLWYAVRTLQLAPYDVSVKRV